MSNTYKYKFGWIPDLPDIRDYTDKNRKLYPMMSKIKTTKISATLPETVDLRQWCSLIDNQGNIGSCTANAIAAVVEYFENRSFNKYIDASRLFLYKVSRNLLHNTGDTGSYLKTTLGALVLFGMPPEEYWPYNESNFDVEPNAFCYSFANNYRCISYFRHDPAGVLPKNVLQSVKKYLVAGIPSVFGFTVYQSISQADATGLIPFPSGNEQVIGGHAVAAVGYDDALEIKNKIDGKTTKGAILIKNSWGNTWGDRGFGWLPYEYILEGIALDWWSLLKQDWVDTGLFV